MLDLSDRRFLRSLRLIQVMTRRIFKGQKVGSRKTLDKGASVDFKDYKEYNPGDDPRFIDWNVYGRLDRILVKVFHSEEDVNVYVLVDGSASMDFGQPRKFDYARKVAAAISYLATTGNDRCRIATFADGLVDHSPHAERPGHILNLLRFLEKTRSDGPSNLDRAVRDFLLRYKRRGVVFVISDLFTTTNAMEALRTLRFHKYDVNLVQVLSDEEIMPLYQGHYQLVDSEQGDMKELNIDQSVLSVYQQVLSEMTEEVESFARKYGINYCRAATSEPFENTVLRLFGCRTA